jgi:hypothetical protein
LPAEVEAKVRLLAADGQAGGADITQPSHVFWHEIVSLRLSSDRLLDLMDRKDLWDDVDWQDHSGRGLYNRMVERLALSAERFFRPEHADRLRAVLDRERRTLWWSGRAALSIGISRLAPPADTDLDDSRTRDGTLRAAIRDDPDVFTRAHVARELVRVGLPRNAAFLTATSFTDRHLSCCPDVPQSILRELGKPPLTNEKRTFLRELLLDKRFEPLWTLPNGQLGREDRYRQAAAHVVNIHAGEEILSERDLRQAAEMLPEILTRVADALK